MAVSASLELEDPTLVDLHEGCGAFVVSRARKECKAGYQTPKLGPGSTNLAAPSPNPNMKRSDRSPKHHHSKSSWESPRVSARAKDAWRSKNVLTSSWL